MQRRKIKIYLPPISPYTSIITCTLGDHVHTKNANDDRMAPNIATFRQPYAATRALDIGPEIIEDTDVFKNNTKYKYYNIKQLLRKSGTTDILS